MRALGRRRGRGLEGAGGGHHEVGEEHLRVSAATARPGDRLPVRAEGGQAVEARVDGQADLLEGAVRLDQEDVEVAVAALGRRPVGGVGARGMEEGRPVDPRSAGQRAGLLAVDAGHVAVHDPAALGGGAIDHPLAVGREEGAAAVDPLLGDQRALAAAVGVHQVDRVGLALAARREADRRAVGREAALGVVALGRGQLLDDRAGAQVRQENVEAVVVVPLVAARLARGRRLVRALVEVAARVDEEVGVGRVEVGAGRLALARADHPPALTLGADQVDLVVGLPGALGLEQDPLAVRREVGLASALVAEGQLADVLQVGLVGPLAGDRGAGLLGRGRQRTRQQGRGQQGSAHGHGTSSKGAESSAPLEWIWTRRRGFRKRRPCGRP